ncbi:MAG: hypothetical protein AB7S42_04690 [Lysobacteraceae bacterium]
MLTLIRLASAATTRSPASDGVDEWCGQVQQMRIDLIEQARGDPDDSAVIAS